MVEQNLLCSDKLAEGTLVTTTGSTSCTKLYIPVIHTCILYNLVYVHVCTCMYILIYVVTLTNALPPSLCFQREEQER